MEDSIIAKLSKQDQVRRQIFEQAGLISSNLIIQQDFNFKTTIERGIYQSSIKSVKTLLRKVFTINMLDYNNIIMIDLPIILANNRITINEFFESSKIERIESSRAQQGYCNMEIPLHHNDLPVFSDKQQDYFAAASFKDPF
jgi:hypothetical protein